MRSFLKLSLLSCFITLQGCTATGYVLDHYVGDDNRYKLTQTSDKMLAIGKIQDKNEQNGMLFLAEQHSYLITRGAPELLAIIQHIPAEKRLLISALPIEFRVNSDDSNQFNGSLTFAYATPLHQLDALTIQKLKDLGFTNQQKLKDQQLQENTFLTATLHFTGTIYQAVESKNIQHQFSQPYPIVLKQHVRINTPKSANKTALGLALTPLALAVDIVTLPVGIVVGTGLVGYAITQPDAWK